ncbi:MAG: hypothetical protein WAZ18_06460 [Alphaproteobacteria bacterium]
MDKRIDKLAMVKGWFEEAVGSAAYQAWRKEAKAAWDFYDGNQWTREEVEALSEHGQPAIVINRIAAKVDNLAGSEVAGRTRVIYRSRSGAKGEEDTARVLTDLALYVAERNDQALEVSAMFKAGLVGGIGWLDVGVEERDEGAFIFNRCEDEFAVVWDPSARRPDLSDARFVARERWLDAEEVGQLFPDKAGKVLEAMQGSMLRGGQAYGLAMAGRGAEVAYVDDARGVHRVVEVQYKELARHWRVRKADGTLVSTFDKAVVTALGKGCVVEEVSEIPQVRVAYFAGDVLLDDRELAYGHNGFTLIPYVYKRHKADGRPYGLVRAAMDPQRELNKRRSKAMHLLNTAQVIADVDAVDDPNMLAREAARPDGVILKRSGKDLRIIRNSDLAASQVSVMEQAGRDIQDVMGVFDENMGKPSNAVSGVAIQQRQMAGAMNQMFAFDALRMTKKRLGEQVLALVRQFFSHEMVILITDVVGAGRQVRLNTPVRDDAGAPIVLDGVELRENDVRSGVFDVVVEEVKDVMSGREQDARNLELLVKAGVPIPPAVLVEASGVRDKEKILAGLGQKD